MNLNRTISQLFLYEEAIEKNIRAGLLELTDTHLRVTERGLFYLHDVLIDFME